MDFIKLKIFLFERYHLEKENASCRLEEKIFQTINLTKELYPGFEEHNELLQEKKH